MSLLQTPSWCSLDLTASACCSLEKRRAGKALRRGRHAEEEAAEETGKGKEAHEGTSLSYLVLHRCLRILKFLGRMFEHAFDEFVALFDHYDAGGVPHSLVALSIERQIAILTEILFFSIRYEIEKK